MTDDIRNNLFNIERPRHITLTAATANTLSEAIQEGKFKAGSQMPSETELMQMLQISRTTLREALRMLEEQGLIIRRRGLGTYVSKRLLVNDIAHNFGITQMITQAGLDAGTLESDNRIEKASSATAKALELDENADVLVMERIRTADGIPVVWSFDMVPADIVGNQVTAPEEHSEESLYIYLQKYHNVWITQGVAEIQPIVAEKEHAAKLNVPKHTPLLCIVQTDYDNKNRPVIYAVEYHLADRIKFILTRKGPNY
jgi:GntR family transcriptional regulator